MSTYLGDWTEDSTHYFLWNTNDSNGAAITRTVNGTVSVYKDNNITQSVAGITDTEDFDGVTGVHLCIIDTSADAFYVTDSDYTVVLTGATIDGQTVNATIAYFSIENREVDTIAISGDKIAANALESMLDGSGGSVLTLEQLRIDSTDGNAAVYITNSFGHGIRLSIEGAGNDGINIWSDERYGVNISSEEDCIRLTSVASVEIQATTIIGDLFGGVDGDIGGSIIGNVGGNVAGTVAAVTGAINTAAGTITTLDGLSGADGDTLKILSDEHDALAATLTLIKAVTDGLSESEVQFISVVGEDNIVTIVSGDDYTTATSNALTWTITNYTGPALGAADVTFKANRKRTYDDDDTLSAVFTKAGSITHIATTVTITVELTATETIDFHTYPPDERYNYQYQTSVILGGAIITKFLGAMTVLREV